MLGDKYYPLSSTWLPIRWGQSDHLLVSFCALAIVQATGTEVPTVTGKIIFGDEKRIKNCTDHRPAAENAADH